MRSLGLKLALIGTLVLFVGACAATAFAAVSSPDHSNSVAASAATPTPTLGVKPSNDYESGFGTVKPKVVSFGGDGQSLVTAVKWSAWGGSRAVGHGRASWVWPGWCSACGSVELKATVVAYDLGRCNGHSAYQYVEWFFPSRGQTFTKRNGQGNLCHKQLRYPSPDTKQRRCGTGVLVNAGRKVVGDAKQIDAYGLKCSAAKGFVKISGATAHYRHNARFHTHGWWCGSELAAEITSKPWQDFSCVKGNFKQLYFSIKRTSA